MELDIETIGMVMIVILIAGFAVYAIYMPTTNPFAPNPTPLQLTSPSPTPTPQTTPNPTPTHQPSPIPPPSIPPSPSPSPTATPLPTPVWQGLGFKCEVPSHLIGEKWVDEFKFSCACLLRGKYDLGYNFNVWEACYSSTSTGWRRESCECIELICQARRDLC
jgi:hypothetical protein